MRSLEINDRKFQHCTKFQNCGLITGGVTFL